MIFKAKKIMKYEDVKKLKFTNAKIVNVKTYPHEVTAGRIEVVVEVEID